MKFACMGGGGARDWFTGFIVDSFTSAPMWMRRATHEPCMPRTCEPVSAKIRGETECLTSTHIRRSDKRCRLGVASRGLRTNYVLG